jgi:hypothetical protein
MDKLKINPRTHQFYLLHYSAVRFRALLIRDILNNSYIFSDKDFPGHFEKLTDTDARWYLSHRPDLLDLSNPHHKDMIENFGLEIENRIKEAK